MIQAAVAFGLDWRVHNWMRGVALELFLKHGIGMSACREPPHLSLRSSFNVERMQDFEAYFAQLAASLEPLTITLTDLKLWANAGLPCVLFLDVAEQDLLKPLHHKITSDLNLPFNRFDGDEFHFHATVMLEPLSAEQLEQVQTNFVGRAFNQQVKIDHLLLYLKADQTFHKTHQILPLGATHADVPA